jgi:glycerol transport system ATP-binding protein
MLELKGVCKHVGAERHITDVSIRLEKGSLNVLLGPTLSGKTTLMRLMAGLDRPTKGSIVFDGKDRRCRTGAQCRDGLPAIHQLPRDDGL